MKTKKSYFKGVALLAVAVLVTSIALIATANSGNSAETDLSSLKNGVELAQSADAQNLLADVSTVSKCGEGEDEDKDKGDDKKCGEGEDKCGEGKCGDGDESDKKCGEGKCGEGEGDSE